MTSSENYVSLLGTKGGPAIRPGSTMPTSNMIKLNGKLVVDNVVLENYWERDKPIYPTGQIELQNHGNTLWFRNIFLRELGSN